MLLSLQDFTTAMLYYPDKVLNKLQLVLNTAARILTRRAVPVPSPPGRAADSVSAVLPAAMEP